MDGKDAIQGANRLWLLHQMLLSDPTLSPWSRGLGLGQPGLGFVQKQCSWGKKKQKTSKISG